MQQYLSYIHENVDLFMEKEVVLKGWIRNHRKQKEFGFIDFYDGTSFKSMQVVYESRLPMFEDIQKLKVGSCIKVRGLLKESTGGGQDYEVVAEEVSLIGDCPEDYPIQPKRHTREFLREQAYLRPRVNLFQAVFRIRSLAAHAIHTYFQDRGFVYVHTPLITKNDGEGAGEMFQVTTLDLDRIAKSGKVEYDKDFYNAKVGLAVTGQLEGETFAMAFNKIYTFGPTFRAENSNTKTHASEFWMIEPEVAFYDINDLMDLEEDMLKYIIKYVLKHAKNEMEFLDKFVENGLIAKLNDVVSKTAVRISHKEVIDILQKADVAFENEPIQGEDIAKEHEKYITKYFDGPVFVTDWPKDIKAFYMKLNPDNKTVAAVDLLVPGAGELMGGSQREEDYHKLVARMDGLGMNKDELDWYINLRKFGGCPHSGFGMGFERLLIYLTGVDNIRDVIPYPRTPGNCEY